jgi:hypothetical protein
VTVSKVKKKKIVVNLDLARRVVKAVKPGLTAGLGRPKPGEMCVEAAVCYALGLPHDDDPPCVGSAARRIKIGINDSTRWTSKKARARGMLDASVAQLGSNEVNQMKVVRVYRRLVKERLTPLVEKHISNTHTIGDGKTTLREAAKMRLSQQPKTLGDSLDRVVGYQVVAKDLSYMMSRQNDPLRILAECLVDALREVGSPGVKLLNKLKKEGVV